tara:strand:- start:1190 stop:2026 length:837 start_codon:yes stop_codon:yes gene_type:complete
MFLDPLKKTEIENLFLDESSKSILEYYLKKNLSSIPEVRELDSLPPLRIPKEYLEIWISQMLDGQPIGSGNYPVDVIVSAKNIAIDISGLSVSKNKNGSFKKYTGEKSLAQKFDSDNYGQHDEDLDDLFKHSEASKVVDAFKSILIKKYEKVFVENKVKSIYILNFIFNNNDKEIYLSVLKVDKDRINNFTAGNISKTTCVFNNAINIDYGEIKAYKAKKRLELRLNINGLIEANCIYKIKYSFGGKVRKINFRDELIKDKKFINNLSEAQAINIFYE